MISNMSKKRLNILYVDKDLLNRKAFYARYKFEFSVYLSKNEFEANAVLRQEQINIVVSDHMLKQVSGVEFLNMVRRTRPEIMTVLLTFYSDDQVLTTVVRSVGIHHCLRRPYNHYALEGLFRESPR